MKTKKVKIKAYSMYQFYGSVFLNKWEAKPYIELLNEGRKSKDKLRLKDFEIKI